VRFKNKTTDKRKNRAAPRLPGFLINQMLDTSGLFWGLLGGAAAQQTPIPHQTAYFQ
jgi:hypothetical protein